MIVFYSSCPPTVQIIWVPVYPCSELKTKSSEACKSESSELKMRKEEWNMSIYILFNTMFNVISLREQYYIIHSVW